MGMTEAAAEPLPTRSNTSAERAQGTTAQPGSICSAASWLKDPSSPWMATFMAEAFITGKVAGEAGKAQIDSSVPLPSSPGRRLGCAPAKALNRKVREKKPLGKN